METKPEMTSSALIELLKSFESAGIIVWLDGGWGIDALLWKQTRTHNDVDIVLEVSNVPALCELLAQRGFVIKEGAPPDSFVLANGSGLEVDVHAVAFDQEGNGVYRMQNGEDWIFPAEGFGGQGRIGELPVRCLSPTTQVLCHAYGYIPREKDFHDMRLLKERFGVELPANLRPAIRE